MKSATGRRQKGQARGRFSSPSTRAEAQAVHMPCMQGTQASSALASQHTPQAVLLRVGSRADDVSEWQEGSRTGRLLGCGSCLVWAAVSAAASPPSPARLVKDSPPAGP